MIDFLKFKSIFHYKFSEKINPYLFVIASIFSISPVIHFYLPIKGNLISLAFVLMIINLNAQNILKKFPIWTLIFLSFFLSAPAVIYWGEPKYFLIQIYFDLSLIILFCLSDIELQKIINLMSIIFLILLLCSFIGFFYAYFDGNPIAMIKNPDGRNNWLYLTTFSNSIHGNLIRPSAIFDEPGALSFLICILVCMRENFCFSRKVNWLLLIAGFITFSVAHFIFSFFYLIYTIRNYKNYKKIIWIASKIILIVFLINLMPQAHQVFKNLFFARFNSDIGHDRIITTLNAVSYLNFPSFFWGLDSDCALGFINCLDKGYLNYGDNPLTLMVHWGFLISFPYYFTLVYVLWRGFKKNDLHFFGLFFLLLQRPYVMSYGYSLIIVFAIFYSITQHHSNFKT